MKKILLSLLLLVVSFTSITFAIYNVSWSASSYESGAIATYTFNLTPSYTDYPDMKIFFPVGFVYTGNDLDADIRVTSGGGAEFIPYNINFTAPANFNGIWLNPDFGFSYQDVPYVITIANIVNPSAGTYSWASDLELNGEGTQSATLSDITILDEGSVAEYPICSLDAGLEWYYFNGEIENSFEGYFSGYDENNNPVFVLADDEGQTLLYFSGSQWIITNQGGSVFASSDTIYGDYTPTQLWIDWNLGIIGIRGCEDEEDNQEYEYTGTGLVIDNFETYGDNGLWYTGGGYGDWGYGYDSYGGWYPSPAPEGSTPSDTYWIADCTQAKTGNCSSRSFGWWYNDLQEDEDAGSNTVAEMTKAVILPSAGYITFWAKVSSEEGYDGLSFWIDGVSQSMGTDNCLNLDSNGSIDLLEKGGLSLSSSDYLYDNVCPFYFVSGESDWTLYSFPISAGSHVITFLYTKDGSEYDGQDRAWVDDVIFYSSGIIPQPQHSGGGGGSISSDNCSNGDNSGSYYDGKCDGTNPQVKPNPIKLPKLKLNQIEKKNPLEFCKYNDTKGISAAFTDVVGTPYASAVGVLVSHCLVQGYNNNGQEFGINNPLKRGELYKIFTRMALLDFDLNTPGLGWSHGYKIAGESIGLWNLLNMTKDQEAIVSQQELLQVTMNYLKYMGVLDEAPEFAFGAKQVTRGEFARFINMVLGLVSTK